MKTITQTIVALRKFCRPGTIRLSTFTLLLLALPGLTVSAQTSKVQLTPTGPHEVTSAICGTCHKEIFAEWETSMHAQSSALSDPIHEAFYRSVMGDPLQEGVTNKKGKYPVCLQCHAPNAAMQKKTKLDATASFDEGVSCIFCHTISSFKGTHKEDGKLQLGAAAYEVSTSALQSPSGRNFTTAPVTGTPVPGEGGFHPFPMVAGDQALIKSDALCMGCHDRRNNANGVPLCVTGDEIMASDTGVSCQSCHMPTTPNGHSSHTMTGGHDANTVRRGVIMALEANPEADGVKASLNITNRLPHKFPTGAPFRTVVIKITAFDEQGQSVWESPDTDAFKEESDSILVYRLGDGTGLPTTPPKAKESLSDTRLAPHESRVIEYSIPVSGVKKVRADLYYSLLWPNLVKKLEDKLSDDLKDPKHVASAEANL